MNKEYKKFLKQHRLTDKKVGEMFGYKNRQSWHGAPRKDKVVNGILKIAEIVSDKNIPTRIFPSLKTHS